MNLQTKKWKIITSPEGKAYTDAVGYTWAPEGQSIVFQDLYNIYEVGIDGELKRRIPLKGLPTNNIIGSMQINKDRTKIIFSCGVETFSKYEGLHSIIVSLPFLPYYVPMERRAIFIYDFKTKTLSEISPANMDATGPRWGANEKEIIFYGQPIIKLFGIPFEDTTALALYSISEDGKEVKFLMPVSVSNSFCIEQNDTKNQ